MNINEFRNENCPFYPCSHRVSCWKQNISQSEQLCPLEKLIKVVKEVRKA